MPEYISNAVHERIMAKRDAILRLIEAWLPIDDADLVHMYDVISRDLHIPVDRVQQIESTCVGHVDYAAKFALRLAFEYWGIE